MALGVSTFTKIESSSGTSANATLSRTPASGSTIAVAASAFWSSGSNPTSLLAVSDATNGSYTSVGSNATGGGSALAGVDDTVGLFYHTSVAATAASVTITGGTGTNGVVGIPMELTGFTGSITVDVPGTPTATGNSSTVTSSALTNSQANSIYVASIGDNSSGPTLTPGSSFTSAGSETNGSSFPVTDGIYLIVSSTASRTATETINSSHWAVSIAAFSDNGGSSTTGTVAVTLGQPSLALTGTEVFTGTAAVTLGQPSLALTGTISITGTAAVTLGQPSLALTGTVQSGVTGTGAVILAGPSLALTVTEVFTGTGATTLNGVSLTATGAIGITGPVALTLRGVSVAGVGTGTLLHLGQFPPCLGTGVAGSIHCCAVHSLGSVPNLATQTRGPIPNLTP